MHARSRCGSLVYSQRFERTNWKEQSRQSEWHVLKVASLRVLCIEINCENGFKEKKISRKIRIKDRHLVQSQVLSSAQYYFYLCAEKNLSSAACPCNNLCIIERNDDCNKARQICSNNIRSFLMQQAVTNLHFYVRERERKWCFVCSSIFPSACLLRYTTDIRECLHNNQLA